MADQERTLLWQHVAYWAERNPDGEALVFNDTRMTWAEFNEAVDRCARAFLAAGIMQGDRIAMVTMGRPEFIITFMAASKVGATWLGLSPKFTTDELRYIIGHCQPALLITLHEYMGIDLIAAGQTFAEEFPSILEIVVIGEPHPDFAAYEDWACIARPELDEALAQRAAEVSETDDVLLMYTSGSTGKPKGVLQSHHAIIENIRAEIVHFGIREGSRLLLHFPVNHVAGDVELGFGAVMGGSTLVFMDAFDPQASLEVIERERITMVGQVPVMFLMQFQTPKFKAMDWSHVECFVWGGAGVPQLVLDVLKQIAGKTGARLLTGYGSTELCGFVTYTTGDEDNERMAKSVGKIVPPFEFKIVDPRRAPVPNGTIGELAVRGPSVMKGYLNNPKATRDVIDGDGWYYTSDLGWADDEGYIFLSGRSSEMYKSGGENVFPREIEEVLESHSAVLFAAVLGVPDPLYQEAGHGFVMLKPGQSVEAEALREHCKLHLANFKVPKRFTIAEALPLLPNGKVNKMALRAQLNSGEN
jgi:acyl-CoA synthetase (AMP-forming)/AMP-acid ligase II